MKTLCSANEKGGVGKTTLAAHIAWFFSDAGLRVLAIDVDQQCNLSHMLQNYDIGVSALDFFREPVSLPRSATPLALIRSDPRINETVDRGSEEAVGIFAQNVADAAAAFDVCVIDTPPALRTLRTIAAVYASDYVIAPLELGDFSIMGVAALLQFLEELPEATDRDPLNFLGLLPCKFVRTSPAERERLQVATETFGKVLFPNAIPRRDVYTRAVTERLPVWRMGSSGRDAGKEIKAVLSEIAVRMGVEIPLPEISGETR